MDASSKAAVAFLRDNGASDRLLKHAEFVRATADGLIEALRPLGVLLDEELVRAGALLHDAGKTAHPEELHSPGIRHEAAGTDLLLRAGYPPAVARICVSHAQWASMPCSIEELIVALADKLWKGKREDALEALVIDRIALASGREKWDVFQLLDFAFEDLAAAGHQRVMGTRGTA